MTTGDAQWKEMANGQGAKRMTAKTLTAAMLLAAMTALPLVSAKAVSDKPVEEDPTYWCRQAFETAAEARKTCVGISFSVISEDVYRVSGRCEGRVRAGEYKNTSVVVTDSRRCGDLTNCDAKLVVGDCGW